MSLAATLRTYQFGASACKGIHLDGWAGSVRLHLDRLTRDLPITESRPFPSTEDIASPILVFAGVDRFDLRGGRLPNERILALEVTSQSDSGITLDLRIAATDDNGRTHESTLALRCASVHLFDPRREGEDLLE